MLSATLGRVWTRQPALARVDERIPRTAGSSTEPRLCARPLLAARAAPHIPAALQGHPTPGLANSIWFRTVSSIPRNHLRPLPDAPASHQSPDDVDFFNPPSLANIDEQEPHIDVSALKRSPESSDVRALNTRMFRVLSLMPTFAAGQSLPPMVRALLQHPSAARSTANICLASFRAHSNAINDVILRVREIMVARGWPFEEESTLCAILQRWCKRNGPRYVPREVWSHFDMLFSTARTARSFNVMLDFIHQLAVRGGSGVMLPRLFERAKVRIRQGGVGGLGSAEGEGVRRRWPPLMFVPVFALQRVMREMEVRQITANSYTYNSLIRMLAR